MKIYHGKVAQEGMACGPVYLMKKRVTKAAVVEVTDIDKEYQKYQDAKAIASQEMDVIFAQALKEVGEEAAEIIQVQKMMLDDADFEEMIEGLIKNDKKPATSAVSETGEYFHDFFAGLDDPYMNARSADIADLALRLERIITGGKSNTQLEEAVVIVAEDLLPSELLGMDKDKVLAFVTSKGSLSSHVAILAKTGGIPAIMQTNFKIDEIKDGEEILVDAYDNNVYLQADEETKAGFLDKKVAMGVKAQELEAVRGLPTETKSGRKIHLCANIGSAEDAKLAMENDAEGIGLLRSEFLYLESKDYPSEDTQFVAYKAVAEVMKERQVIIRTADIGADKTVDYFELEPEENPALGFRAVRICFERPKMFKTQLRAIYRASVYGNLAIMFPMITSLEEVIKCKQFAAEAKQEVIDSGGQCKDVALGVMIETPAAALMADILAQHVDFFSVGTNDLQQYTFAVDRQNDKVSDIVDKNHPGFLKLMAMIAKGANDAGIWAGICGDLGADSELVEKFVEMGYKELSVPPNYILKTRDKIRNIE